MNRNLYLTTWKRPEFIMPTLEVGMVLLSVQGGMKGERVALLARHNGEEWWWEVESDLNEDNRYRSEEWLYKNYEVER